MRQIKSSSKWENNRRITVTRKRANLDNLIVYVRSPFPERSLPSHAHPVCLLSFLRPARRRRSSLCRDPTGARDVTREPRASGERDGSVSGNRHRCTCFAGSQFSRARMSTCENLGNCQTTARLRRVNNFSVEKLSIRPDTYEY